MKGIEIKVGVYSEEEIALKDLNLPINDDECDLWEIRTFWRVDSAMINREHPKQTVFFMGGDSFITPMLYEDFVKLIDSLKQ